MSERDARGPEEHTRGHALFCVAALSLPALFVAPLVARWSARAPVSVLRRLFALCLAVIAVRLVLRP
jgi:small neutral amino acid transporter SnatA (MarC family)